MLNHIVVMGRLTRDPEYKTVGSGISCCNFSIAADRDFGGKDGGQKETDFFDCVAWRKTAEFVTSYFTKGRMIVVSGRLQSRSWTDKDGNKRKSYDIVAENCYFGDSKPAGSSSITSPNYSPIASQTPAPASFPGFPETEEMFNNLGFVDIGEGETPF